MTVFDDGLLGSSPEFASVVRAAKVVAATDVTVLLCGESGTGKELLASAIHKESRRSNNPLVTINCSAIPDSLAESELFGYRKGSFTGATSNYDGLIQSADGGTLFLDEIGELSPAIQAKLLRFLETGEVQGIGKASPTKVDVRVISATNRDLHTEVKQRRFREDLFYRLQVVPVELPPLRKRTGDINLLLNALTTHFASLHRLSSPFFNTASIKVLNQYYWPGNVRELRNFCERMVILCNGKEIAPQNLPREFFNEREQSSFADGISELLDSGRGLVYIETELIKSALLRSRGNQSKAARLLGLTRDTLLYRIKKHAISL